MLDEPTAHLDAANRDLLMADLLAATTGRSLLRHGRVIERGTHAQLLASGGLYRNMWLCAERNIMTRQRPRSDN